MKITRKQLRQILERVKYGSGTSVSDVSTAREYESLAMSSLLKKKQQYELLHNMTKKSIAGNPILKKISDWCDDFARPSASGGAPLTPGSLAIDHIDGLPSYAFCSRTSNDAPNADNNFNALYSGDQLTNSTANQIMIRCLSTTQDKSQNFIWPDNSGEKLEPAMAIIMAAMNPGECFAALQTSSAGKDLIHVGGNEYFELKYSDSESGEVNDNFSASPPTVNATDKYIIFLSSDRSYFVHTPLLARLASVGSDVMPTSTDAAANMEYNSKLIFYLQEQPEVRETCLNAAKLAYQKSLDSDGKYVPEDQHFLMDEFINSINTSTKSQECINALRALYVINQTREASGKEYKGKGSTPDTKSIPLSITRIEADFDDGFLKNNNSALKTSSEIISQRYGSMVYGMLAALLSNLTIAWGFNQMSGLVVFPAGQVITAGEGGAYSYQRIVGKTSSGKNYEQVLSPSYTDADLPAKANLIFNMVNDPSVPNQVKEELLNLLQGIESSGTRKQSSVYLETVDQIKKDPQSMRELMIELMRGAEGRQLILEYILLPTFRQRIKSTAVPGFKEFNKALGNRASEVLNGYINNMSSEMSGRQNDFWTNYDRDNQYDGTLFKIFVEDNINAALSVFFSDDTFRGFITTAISAINDIADNFKSEFIKDLKDKDIDKRIENFKSLLTPEELAIFEPASYPDKVDFMTTYARNNRIPHPLRDQQISHLKSPMADPEEMEIYSESKLYASVIQELIAHAQPKKKITRRTLRRMLKEAIK